MNQIINNGTYILRYPTDTTQKTIIVSGLGRCGTTALINSLRLCDVYIKKEQVAHRTLDDWGIGTFLDDRDSRSLRKEITRRNLEHDVWAFKWHMVPHWNSYLSMFRNPLLLVLTRDPTAIACRSSTDEDGQENYKQWLKDIALWQMQLSYCVTNEITIPTMLISYEKLLLNTRTVLSTVCSFCGIPCKEEAVQAIIANDSNYTSSVATGKSWLDDNN